MVDKSKRTAIAKRESSMIVIRMNGGPDCLWLNMYLDTENIKYVDCSHRMNQTLNYNLLNRKVKFEESGFKHQ